MKRFLRPVFALSVFVVSLGLSGIPAFAQTTSPAPLARWIDVQSLTLNMRYRAIRNSADVLVANQLQERTQLRLRVKLDPQGRYAVHVGVFTGGAISSGWNSTGIGTGEGTAQHSLKQLFFAATPVDGLELQYGSLYPSRGESTEITTYDDDAYLAGGRVSVREPERLFFDDVTLTLGNVGYLKTPAVNDRWEQFEEVNYGQVLVSRQVDRVAASFDYTRLDGENWFRPAVAVAIPESGALDRVRLEVYRRGEPDEVWGLSVAGEKQVAPRLRLVGGYATIDRDYPSYNGDRYFTGDRVFLHVNVPVTSEFSLSLYTTHTVGDNPGVPVQMRTDVVASYNLVPALKRAGVF
jgi:hypothetical protein